MIQKDEIDAIKITLVNINKLLVPSGHFILNKIKGVYRNRSRKSIGRAVDMENVSP